MICASLGSVSDFEYAIRVTDHTQYVSGVFVGKTNLVVNSRNDTRALNSSTKSDADLQCNPGKHTLA